MNDLISISDIRPIFEAVQKAKIFDDQKTMADAIPLFPTSEINKRFEEEKEHLDFRLCQFIKANFKFTSVENRDKPGKNLTLLQNIEQKWNVLKQETSQAEGTLIPLPKPYIAPGGRFKEFFYWDSYFIMLGLQQSGRIEMMWNFVLDAAYLISKYGFYPTANRTYFLSRSQPPYFALMIELLAQATKDKSVYTEFFEPLEREYEFWMEGAHQLQPGEAHRRVVKLSSGEVLNRYYDEENVPRPESFIHDYEDAENTKDPEFYRQIRAACESGWDFSSRWFEDGENISSIYTLSILPVDLNSLLWNMENLLLRMAKREGNEIKADYYQIQADKRKQAINHYFWDEKSNLYRDYNFKKEARTPSEHLGTIYPLYFELATSEQAKKVAHSLKNKFLKPGGIITTTKNTSQQWDAPNVWAPLQWIAVQGLINYGHLDLAKGIASNWCQNVEFGYAKTGKIMEKYNGLSPENIGEGGEYRNQIGFGWTNGVYSQLKNQFSKDFCGNEMN